MKHFVLDLPGQVSSSLQELSAYVTVLLGPAGQPLLAPQLPASPSSAAPREPPIPKCSSGEVSSFVTVFIGISLPTVNVLLTHGKDWFC